MPLVIRIKSWSTKEADYIATHVFLFKLQCCVGFYLPYRKPLLQDLVMGGGIFSLSLPSPFSFKSQNLFWLGKAREKWGVLISSAGKWNPFVTTKERAEGHRATCWDTFSWAASLHGDWQGWHPWVKEEGEGTGNDQHSSKEEKNIEARRGGGGKEWRVTAATHKRVLKMPVFSCLYYSRFSSMYSTKHFCWCLVLVLAVENINR